MKLERIIGKKIAKVFYSPEYLIFEDDAGIQYPYTVEAGCCCSTSLFYDFFGLDVLIGGTIKEVKEVNVEPSDIYSSGDYGRLKDQCNSDDSIQVYGYQITLEPEDNTWGERTAVFSFRNYSNGYYGGDLIDMRTVRYGNKEVELTPDEQETLSKVPQLTHDTHCVCILTGEYK